MEGKLRYKKHNAENPYAFLFDDMLVLCSKEPGTTQYHRKKVIYFNNITAMSVVDLDAESDSSSHQPNGHQEKRKSGGFFSTKSEIGRDSIELRVTKEDDGKLVEKVYRCVCKFSSAVVHKHTSSAIAACY